MMSDPKDIRVLVAEDDYLASQMIKEVLRKIGYTIVGKAVDGRQAIEMTAQLTGTRTQPDVVLIDIKMPDMDGIEAARLIQERCPTPVVVLTTHEMPELVAEASAAGVGAYLVKPPEVKEMERAITIALARFDGMMALQESNLCPEDTLTELKATQEEMVQQERLAAVDQLAAGIAHDFNNILASIALYTQMSLRAPELAPQVHERLESIIQKSRRAADLVQQMLDFGRRATLRREALDLTPFLKETIVLLERTLPENIKIDLACGPALGADGTSVVEESGEYAAPLTINADPTRIQQAIVNLAFNARDAMPEGGELRIGLERLRVEECREAPLPEMQAGEWIQVTMTDTGTGIPPEVLPHIFEPFFTTRAPLGHGLGLAQVYSIVRQHEGYINVETQVGADCGQSGGTTFTLYWPALPVSRPEAVEPELPGLPQGNGETILVVEDNAAMRAALVDVLEVLNYRVLEAANGREALAVFEQQEKVSLILSDWVMPLMGGLELVRELRQRHLPVNVLMLTGHPLDKATKERLPEGAVGWVRKPLSLEQLAEVVARTLAEE